MGHFKNRFFAAGRDRYNFPAALLILVFHLCAHAQTWVPEANFPAGGRQYCSYFSIGSMGYIGFGNNNQVNDFWAYNPSTNQWTQMASIPEAGGRAEMIQFVIGDKGYVGMGFNASGESNEFWQYDPSTDSWTAVAPFPGMWSRGSFTFTVNGKGYVGSGVAFINGNVDYSQLYEYDPMANSWTQKNAIPTGAQRYFGVGFSSGSYGYAGTGVIGSTAQQDFWQYDPVADSWTQKADVPGGVRVNGISFQTSSNGFIAMGGSNTGTVYNDVEEYNAGNNTWTAEPNYSGAGRLAGAGFAIGCNIYIGVGFSSSGTDEVDFWQLAISGAALGVTSDTSVCAGSPVALTATGGSSYTWSPDTALSATTGTTVTANPSSSITYTVTSSTGGCGGGGGSASVTITVNRADTAGVTISASPAGPVCKGTPVSYTAVPVNGGASPAYQWKINGTNAGNNNPAFNLPSPDSGDVISCVMTSNGSCITGSPATSNPIVISVIAGPVAGNISPNPSAICSGDSSVLTNTGSTGSIQWQYSPDGVNFNYTGDSSATYKTAALNQSSYFRVISNSSCGADTSSNAKVTVDVVPVPTIFTNDSLICSSDSTLINSSGSYISYHWNDGDNRAYTYVNSAGPYWVTVTDGNGCTASSAHVNIRVYPVPSVSIVQQGDTLSSYGASSYQWIYNDTDIASATSPLFIARKTGNYALQITDTNGCSAVSIPVYVLISGVEDISDEGFLSIYPNPTHGYIFIKGDDISMHINRIDIMDLLSRTIIHKNTDGLPNTGWKVDVSALPAGIYYIKVETDKNEYLRKLVKQ